MNINQLNAVDYESKAKEVAPAGKSPAAADVAPHGKTAAAVYTAGIEESIAVYSEPDEEVDETVTDEISSDEKEEKDDKESLKDASDKLTGDDCRELAEEGMSLELYEAERLDRALERMKTNKTETRENLDERQEKKAEWEKEIDKIAVANKIPDPMKKKIVQNLIDSDLPLTQANIEQVVSALTMSGAVGSLSDEGIAGLIRGNKAATIENIYYSQYSGTQGKPVTEAVWQSVEKQVEEIVKKAGLPADGETMEDARWLMDHQLPVTADSFERLYDLRSIRSDITEDKVFEKISEAMRQGLDPKEAELSSRFAKEAAAAVERFQTISDEAVETLVREGKEISLKNVKEAEGEAISEYDVRLVPLTDNEQASIIKARRMLEEIRLKMTQEAGISLLKKGIRLDTSGLQKIVEGLKDLEDQYYKDSLREAGIPATEEHLSLWKETSQKLYELREAPEYVLGATLRQRDVVTVDSLHTVGETMKAQLEKAGESYEKLMTSPRGDLGDSIQKAFRNVDDILKDMNLPVTADHQRAVRILARNQMDITSENIQSVKAYDSAVTELLTDLKPAVALELIRKGENPLTTPISELTEEVRAVSEEIGAGSEEKYSEFLYKLQNKQGITEDERKSYIGIYRLLNQVEKGDGAAIGTVLKNGQELNLKNLLSAVRSRKQTGMDIAVDDNFGALEELTFNGQRISDQVNAAFSGRSAASPENQAGNDPLPFEEEYAKNTVKRIFDELSPDKLDQMMQNGLDELMEAPIEEIKDWVSQAAGNMQEVHDYFAHMAEELREITANSERAVEFLQQYGADITVENVAAAKTFFLGEKNLSKEIEKKADKKYTETVKEIEDSAGNESDLKAACERAADGLTELLHQEYEKGTDTYESVKELHLLSQGIELARKLSGKEHYLIPMVIDGQITNVNLTVLKGAKETGKIQVGVDSDSIGRLEAEFKVKRQVINGFILCNSKEGLEAMEECRDSMAKELETLGLHCGQITAGLGKKGVENFRSRTAHADSEGRKEEMKILYQAAKVVIDTVRGAVTKHQNI